MTLATARDLALLVLMAQGCVFTLVLGAGLFLATRGLHQGLRWLETTGFPQLQHVARLLAARTRLYSEKVTAPWLKLEVARYQAAHSLRFAFHLLRQRRRLS
jgi:hypothetical protein